MKKAIAMLIALVVTGSFYACGKSETSQSTNIKHKSVMEENLEVADSIDKIEKHVNFGATTYFGAETMNAAEGWDGWYLDFFGIGETLFKLDKEYNANPWLVESYENVDELTWKFQLRDDVYFHNGEKMTAESVKKSLEYMLEHNSRGPEQFRFDEITADAQLLTIKTSVSTPTLCNDLCDPLSVIQYIDESINYDTQGCATGPFYATNFVPNEHLEVTRFEDYWGGKAKINTAAFITYGDQDALAMALQTGEIDIAVMPDYSAINMFDYNDYVLSKAVTTRGFGLQFNVDNTERVVRQAVAMCVDREGFCSLTNGVFTPCWGMFPDSMGFGDTSKMNLSITKYDPEGAKKILEEAGYLDSDGDGYLDKDGKKLSLRLVANESGQAEGTAFNELLVSTCGEVGIEIVIESYSSTSEVLAARDYEVTTYSLGMAPAGNPGYFFGTRIVTNASQNTSGYSNSKVDALYEEFVSTFGEKERNEIALRIEQEVLDDVYLAVCANKMFYCIYDNAITGFNTQPSEYYLLDNMIDISR